jgi:REP element-mobilizing transposase RayT
VARAPRLLAPDVIYHVGSRGVEKRPIFGVLDHDRRVFLSILAHVVRRFRWRLYAYCLMSNHFHLVLDTPEANLSAGMQILKGDYARAFNSLHPDREGVLFERRFWSRWTQREDYTFELARYVALNPVRAGLVRRPEEWMWSSYAATAGYIPAPGFLAVGRLLDIFGGGDHAVVRYAQFVGEGLGDPGRAALAVRDMDGV